jgi:predicted nuclease of restriction endonuclease-like (RecB) superfamily
MIEAYWKIGKEIYEACGESERAAYGKRILAELSERLTAEFGKGFSERNLQMMRRFYLTFQNANALRSELSWTHYRELIKVADRDAREFYLEEAARAGWSSRQLQRQIHTMYYDRILASKDKDSVAAEIETTVPKPEYEQIIKDPYVLEFLDLPANEHYYESDIEQALIDHLQKFLLELGRGFSFVARQKHFNLDDRHFYIDLVFYNYILKCFVLIDLKTSKITHQDVGQMDMYVRMYDELKRGEGDNPTLGIILCSDTDSDIARYSMLRGNEQLFASKYRLCLPSEAELKAEIEAQKQRFIEQHAK